LDPLDILVEKRLEEAERQGVFRDLPHQGQRLELEDLDGVPAELRMSYKLLKNAGYLPEELELKKSLLTLDDLLSACSDPEERIGLERQRSLNQLRFELLMQRRSGNGQARGQYGAAIARKLGGG
jgi:hypothetical protein